MNVKCDELLSSFGFNFNLRRYILALRDMVPELEFRVSAITAVTVGRCRLTPMKPKLKPPGTKRLKSCVIYCFQLLLSNSTCAAT